MLPPCLTYRADSYLQATRKCTILAVACAGIADTHWFAIGRISDVTNLANNLIPTIHDAPADYMAVFAPVALGIDQSDTFHLSYQGMSKGKRILTAGDIIVTDGDSQGSLPELVRILVGY